MVRSLDPHFGLEQRIPYCILHFVIENDTPSRLRALVQTRDEHISPYRPVTVGADPVPSELSSISGLGSLCDRPATSCRRKQYSTTSSLSWDLFCCASSVVWRRCAHRHLLQPSRRLSVHQQNTAAHGKRFQRARWRSTLSEGPVSTFVMIPSCTGS